MFDVQRRYLDIVGQQGFRIPDRYSAYLSHAARMEAAIRSTDDGRRPCHNDLMPGNFIDVGGRLRLIDYEYSGNNDPCFDLGGIWAESGMSVGQLDEMVAEYYGEPRPGRVARARLWAVMWSYGWTLWAAIQVGEGMQYEDFDAWAWAEGHLDRVESVLDGPELDDLLGQLGT
jgi:thiamine kinase-like enzyme